MRYYCLAGALAVTQAPGPTSIGHRWATIDAAIKRMWYLVGLHMGNSGLAHVTDRGRPRHVGLANCRFNRNRAMRGTSGDQPAGF